MCRLRLLTASPMQFLLCRISVESGLLASVSALIGLCSVSDCRVVNQPLHFTTILSSKSSTICRQRLSVHTMQRCMLLRFVCMVWLHGTAPQYVARELRSVANVDSRRRLRSASRSALDVLPTPRVIIGVVASRVWNSLPSDVTTSPSLSCLLRATIENAS